MLRLRRGILGLVYERTRVHNAHIRHGTGLHQEGYGRLFLRRNEFILLLLRHCMRGRPDSDNQVFIIELQG